MFDRKMVLMGYESGLGTDYWIHLYHKESLMVCQDFWKEEKKKKKKKRKIELVLLYCFIPFLFLSNVEELVD